MRSLSLDEFVAEMDDVADVLAAPKPEVLRQLRPMVQQNIRDNFTGSHSPENLPWAARKHEGDGHPLLIDTGAMLQAAVGSEGTVGKGGVVIVDSESLLLGVDGDEIPYAAVHNRGGRNMPQREFMGTSDQTEIDMGEVIADEMLAKAWPE